MKTFLRKKISVFSIFSVLLIITGLALIFEDAKNSSRFDFSELYYLAISIGLFGLFLDFLLSLIIKNKVVLNIIELIVLVCLFLCGYIYL